MAPEEKEVLGHFAALAIAGLVAGLGVLLASKETLTFRIIIGRALSSAALGVGTASAVLFFPAMPFEAKVGAACLVASLGTSGLERLLQAWRGK